MQHDHPPDYKRWDLLDELTVGQAACLWCGIEPGGSHLFMRSQHPEIIAIEQFIENAIREGKITADIKHAVLVMIGDYSKALVKRSELRTLAEELGEKPPFIFPEERHELSAPQKGEMAVAVATLPHAADTPTAKAETVEPPERGQPERGPSAVRPNRRGRKKGVGGYDSTDMPLVEKMHRLIKSGEATSPWRAALMVVDNAHGTRSAVNKVKRLAGKYATKYSPGEGLSD